MSNDTANQTNAWNRHSIIQAFKEYFVDKGHTALKSFPLMPSGGATVMFNNAGMAPMKAFFVQEEQPPSSRITTCQKCVRAGGKHNDLDNVGYTPHHHTFFEMLGNFSFGDYFKQEAIEYAWDFVTNVLKLPAERLLITVFHEDAESEQIWRKIAGPQITIKRENEENFWSMGPIGPCGPCTEIFYLGSNDNPLSEPLEIWNLVFMQYNQITPTQRVPLEKGCVDTGMGVERIIGVLQGHCDNYLGVFKPYLDNIAQVSGVQMTPSNQHAFRILADHIRTCVHVISEQILPSNEGQGYVLRRILRRALLHEYQTFAKGTIRALIQCSIKQEALIYPQIARLGPFITQSIIDEEKRFSASLDRGIKMLAVNTNSTKHRADKAKQLADKAKQLADVVVKRHDALVKHRAALAKLPETISTKMPDIVNKQRAALKQRADKDADKERADLKEQSDTIDKLIDARVKERADETKLPDMTAFAKLHDDIVKQHDDVVKQINDLCKLHDDVVKQINDLCKQHTDVVKKIHAYAKEHDVVVKKLDEEHDVVAAAALKKQSDDLVKQSNASDKQSAALTEQIDNLGKRSNTLKEQAAAVAEQCAADWAMLSGDVAFKLYDTYGFPLDMTQIIMKAADRQVDTQGFHDCMARQQALSKTAAHKGLNLSKQALIGEIGTLPATEFLGYQDLGACVETGDAQLICLANQSGITERANEPDEVYLLLDKTPLYATSGGQEHDTGSIETPTGTVQILDVFKEGKHFIHKGQIVDGHVTIQQSCRVIGDQARRNKLRNNHTATHVLNRILHDMMDGIEQCGSCVRQDGLTFDFSCPQGFKPGDIDRIQELVNEYIGMNLPVEVLEIAYDKVSQIGAIHLKNEAYPSKVRVIQIGSEQSGAKQIGSVPSGSAQSGSEQSGSAQSGAGSSGSEQSGAGPSGFEQIGSVPSGSEQSGSAQSGAGPSGSEQSGFGQSGSEQIGSVPSGSEQSGSEQSGSEQSGSEQSGSGQSGVVFSELCGGTHAANTGSIRYFKILKERSIGTGKRRIEAITGEAALTYLAHSTKRFESLSQELNIPQKDLLEKSQACFKERAKLQKQLQTVELQYLLANSTLDVSHVDESKLRICRLDQPHQAGYVHTLLRQAHAKGIQLLVIWTDKQRINIGLAYTNRYTSEAHDSRWPNDVLEQVRRMINAPKMSNKGNIAFMTGDATDKLETAINAIIQALYVIHKAVIKEEQLCHNAIEENREAVIKEYFEEGYDSDDIDPRL